MTMGRAGILAALVLAAFLAPPAGAETSAARARGHRLPETPRSERTAPEGGWDLRYIDQVQALADHVAARTLRIEARHRPPAPYDPRHLQTEDGAGVVIAAGRLLTTARYLVDATEVRVVSRDGRAVPARIERLDEAADLAVVAFDATRIPGARVVTGFAPVPAPDAGTGASTVIVPATLVGVSASVQIAAILPDDEGGLFLSGNVANGVPVFDRQGRLVALADRPTPDRTRSVALAAAPAEAWLADE
jgi:hypothetical protein